MQPDLPPVDYLLIHYENLPDLQSLHHETVHIHAGKSHPAARLESRILSQVRSPLEQGGYVSAPCQDRGDDLPASPPGNRAEGPLQNPEKPGNPGSAPATISVGKKTVINHP